jgi:hypothetical protein
LEPPYTEPYVRWCERAAKQIKVSPSTRWVLNVAELTPINKKGSRISPEAF